MGSAYQKRDMKLLMPMMMLVTGKGALLFLEEIGDGGNDVGHEERRHGHGEEKHERGVPEGGAYLAGKRVLFLLEVRKPGDYLVE